jgi:hypothetical protein
VPILGFFGLGLGPGALSFGLGVGAGAEVAPPPPTRGFEWLQPAMLPEWIADREGQVFERTFGRTKDDALDTLKEAIKARWPDASRPDALPLQGADRRILRAPTESDAQYAARLLAAHDLWLWGGTPTSMVNIFAPYGYDATTLAVVPNHAVLLDGNLDWFSRYILLGDALYWMSDGAWDDPGVYDDGGTWDSTASIADLDYIRASVRTFKSPWSYPVFLGVQLLDLGGDGFWDAMPGDFYDALGAVWEDVANVVYLTLGHVWDDEAWLGGTPVWDQAGDTWDDYVAPSAGWHIRN